MHSSQNIDSLCDSCIDMKLISIAIPLVLGLISNHQLFHVNCSYLFIKTEKYTMLTSMVKEHHAKQSKRKQEQEVRRKEAIETSNELTQSLVDHLNVG